MSNKSEVISEANAIAEVQSGLGLAIDAVSKMDRSELKDEVDQRGGVVTLDVVKDVWDAHITDLKKSLPLDFGTSSQGVKLKSRAMRLLKDRYDFFVRVDNLWANKDLVGLIDRNGPVYRSDLKSSLNVFSSLEQDAERYLRREYLLRKEIETFLA